MYIVRLMIFWILSVSFSLVFVLMFFMILFCFFLDIHLNNYIIKYMFNRLSGEAQVRRFGE